MGSARETRESTRKQKGFIAIPGYRVSGAFLSFGPEGRTSQVNFAGHWNIFAVFPVRRTTSRDPFIGSGAPVMPRRDPMTKSRAR